ncbi:unnamed protein product [Urochloa humidicola]
MGLLRRSPAVTADEPMRLLLLALLAFCASAAGASICDTANCGRGNCTEMPGPIPGVNNYKCNCDPGWSHALEVFPFSPCIVPDCPFHGDCFNNLSLPLPIGTLKDVCAAVSCGAGGACKTGNLPFSYSCECQPGYANMLNLTTLPCVKNNCFVDKDCSALGLGPAPAPDPAAPVSHSTSPAPTTGGHDSSGTTSSAPPSGTKGSVPPRRLQQLLLLLVTLAMAQVM